MNFFVPIYAFARQKEIDVLTLIDEINDICMSWMGECSEIFSDNEHMEAYVKEMLQNRTMMIERCKEAKKVIIYGAGKVGKTYLQFLEREGIHVIGFAVSKKMLKRFLKSIR